MDNRLTRFAGVVIWLLCAASHSTACAGELMAGAAKVDITDPAAPSRNPLFAKALVLNDGTNSVVLITVDAVAIAELGRIKNDFLTNLRARLQSELEIPPASVLVNASHCHGVVCPDVEQRTFEAVKTAWGNLQPVRVGAGVGQENQIMENRRLRLRNGKETDVRHAYSMPPDEEVVGVGPVDPEIGLLRLDRPDGQTMAVVYNFACHPILGVPSGENTADFPGFASQAIEQNCGPGAVALFLQGCAGDINPIGYKDVRHSRDAEVLGNRLALSALRALKHIEMKPQADIRLVQETVSLPRAADFDQRIAALQVEQSRLLKSLAGTTLNLKTFLSLYTDYHSDQPYPSYYSHRYMRDDMLGCNDMKRLDEENRRNIDLYIQNIYTMEELTRINANIDLLKMHQAQHAAAGTETLDVEVNAVRVGDFVLVTFPGELCVEIGLNIKKRSPADLTFVAGCTNGYIYYAPTEQQRRNPGCAQEDCDCLLAPEWQQLYESRVQELLKRL